MLRRVRQRKVDKFLNVRVEHVRVSNTRKAFVERVQANDRIKTEANKLKKIVSTKRQTAGPREASIVTVDPTRVEYRTQKPFIELH
jgi:large subunit ribosomal protein L21e